MNSEDFKRKTRNALQKTSLQQRCEEVKRIIEDSSTKELHVFFPELLGSIFGYDNVSDWGLKSSTQRPGVHDQLRAFLGHSGPMFKLIDKLQVDGYLKYEYFIKCLPLPTQNCLSEGNIPVLYHNKIQMSNTSSASTRVVLLNAFEYYMFHFAYYVVYQHNNRTSQDSSYKNDANSTYFAILEDYLNHFLPASTVVQTNITSSSTNLHQTPWYNQTTFNRISQSQSQFTGLIRASPSVHIPPAVKGHTTYDHSSGEIWRSETFIQILIEFWLNQNTMDSVTRNVLSHGQLYFMPSVDLVQAVRMLVKQTHMFVHSAGIEALNQPVTSPVDELKRNIIPQMLQKKLYCFVRHGFAHWPLDPSFRVIVETWLSFIQPWRYAKNTKTDAADECGPEWSPFVYENFLFYTAVLQEFALRALKLDLCSSKDVFILLRVTKVLAQAGLVDIIEEGERLLLLSTGTPKSPLRGSPSSLGVSAGSSMRANLLELEGPSYSYCPIFQRPGSEKLERLRCNVSSAQASIRNPHHSASSQITQDSAQGPVAWFKHVFSGDFLAEDGGRSRETDKVASYLEQSFKNLTSIVKVTCDVTDLGEQTIPWATPSAARERHSPSIRSSTSNQSSIPDCVQTERGLIVTDRGKFQMINGLRRFEVQYSGDPELQPIRSYENVTAVRQLYHLSTYLNHKVGDKLKQIYTSPGYMSSIASALSPCLNTTTHNAPIASPITSTQASHDVQSPRISLRFLASYKTWFYLFILYFLCSLFSFSSLTTLAVFILVLFFSILGHICPKYENADDVQKKLF